MAIEQLNLILHEFVKVKSVLRWAGGKQKLVKRLVENLPIDVALRTYREPFLGAASLYFAIQPKKSVLSDANRHLISFYEYIKNEPKAVASQLQKYIENNSEEYYYQIRLEYNSSKISSEQAARFLYLNCTCFNGIFRVNKKGDFNVPYGYKASPCFPDEATLTQISSVLQQATIVYMDYKDALNEVSTGDFVYLDPPYPPLNSTAFFTQYTMDGFAYDNQVELAGVVRDLNDKQCLFMMSNADTPEIRQLYRGFNIISLPVMRTVTCKKQRYSVSELLITNYRSVK